MSSESHKCGKCGDEFDSQQGKSLHQTRMHNEKKWRDEEWLRDQYVDKQKSMSEIAREQDCGQHAISEYLEKFGIEKREHGEEIRNYWQTQPAPFYTGEQHGHEFWRFGYDNDQTSVQHHRLLAVAKCGIDAVKDKVVHHKNGIPWDNREENIEILTIAEHKERHSEEVYSGRGATEKECQKYREKRPEKTYPEIAEEYDTTISTVKYHVYGECRHSD